MHHAPQESQRLTLSMKDLPQIIARFLGVFTYSRRALLLVWQTSPFYTLLLAGLTLIAGVLPTAVAYIGQLIVDAVLAASVDYRRDGNNDNKTFRRSSGSVFAGSHSG